MWVQLLEMWMLGKNKGIKGVRRLMPFVSVRPLSPPELRLSFQLKGIDSAAHCPTGETTCNKARGDVWLPNANEQGAA